MSATLPFRPPRIVGMASLCSTAWDWGGLDWVAAFTGLTSTKIKHKTKLENVTWWQKVSLIFLLLTWWCEVRRWQWINSRYSRSSHFTPFIRAAKWKKKKQLEIYKKPYKGFLFQVTFLSKWSKYNKQIMINITKGLLLKRKHINI